MIPRIHDRGSSFKAAVQYVMHDPQAESAKRVDWAFSVNCGSIEPEEVWRPMYDTWDRRTALKREAGVDLRGADNKAPVMHYTLSWAPDDRLSKQQMTDAALKSLKALGLEDHQALIVAHNDTDHQHVHIVVNTVHPRTGRTAALKYPALALRDFAQEHDRQRGIYEQQRAERQADAGRLPPPNRNNDLRAKSMAMLTPDPLIKSIKPEAQRRSHRRRALERTEIIDRMRRHRAEHDKRHMVERDALWSVHRTERDDLYRRSNEACAVAIAYVHDHFKGPWRELYKAQKDEAKHVDRIRSNPLERAVYVFVNSERLGHGAPLSLKQKAALIASPSKLIKAVRQAHTRERRLLASVEKFETKQRLDRVWTVHETSFQNMAARQSAERQAMKADQVRERERNISYPFAAMELIAERRGEVVPRQDPDRPLIETDAAFVARVRKEIDTHYKRQFGADSVPRIPWNDRPAPIPPTPDAPDPDAEEVKRLLQRRRDGRDFDNGL